jgi:hypothetical protein
VNSVRTAAWTQSPAWAQSDEGLEALAAKMLPVVQEHLKHAEEMAEM